MNNNSKKWLNILRILTIILTVSSFIILGSQLVVPLLTMFTGLIMLVLVVLLALCTLGIIYLTPFGSNVWNTFLHIWQAEFGNKVVKFLLVLYPYVVWINFCINILYLVISIFNKSKKNIIISSVFLFISIVMLILYLIGV